MPRFETCRHARSELPGWFPTFTPGNIGRRVESKAGYDGESVTITRVDRDPFAMTTLAEAAKIRRTHRRLDQSSPTERVRNRAGAIVSAVDKRSMTAAITIWLGTKLIRGPDGALHDEGRSLGRGRLTGA